MSARAAKSDLAALEQKVERLEARNVELARTLRMVDETRTALADHYDFAPIGFVTLDAKGCIREMNITAARMLGRERSRLLSQPFITCVAKPYCRAFLNHLAKCRAVQTEVISEAELRVGGRRTLPVELRSVPVLDPHRGGTVYRTALMDISDRVHTGKALSESEERYRGLVDVSPDGIFVLMDGDIVFANHAALALCGAEKADELLGRRMADLVRPIFRNAMMGNFFRAAHTDRQAPIELKLVRTDGSRIEVEIAAGGLKYEGANAVLVVARDITRRRNAERQVLAISEREKGRFGRDLHDGLSQSLTGAAWRAEALRNHLQKTNPSAAAEADEIAAIMRDCVEETRSLARGLYPVNMERNGIVPALYELASETTRRTGIECTVECDESIAIRNPEVATNLYRISQEAITNAIKHGKANSIFIRLGTVDGSTMLTLRDNGRGFPVKPKESGMGLYTMRYRAAMIGGSLEVIRDGARGTIVTCSFPTNEETR